jgi:hypothetical protein
MLGKLVIPIAAILALLAGGAAGHFMRPPPAETEAGATPEPEPVAVAPADRVTTFREAFVVPILRRGRLWGNVILNLGVETASVSREEVLLMEAVLRDGFTEALFRHGSQGGFDGDFTEPLAMNRLRTRLNEVARGLTGDPEARVLIVSMARQDA